MKIYVQYSSFPNFHLSETIAYLFVMRKQLITQLFLICVLHTFVTLKTEESAGLSKSALSPSIVAS
jgi:hypothetical protein